MGTYKILLHFNGLPQQSVTQFFQNPIIHQKRQNEVLRGNMNMNVSPKSGNYAIGRTPIFSASIDLKLLMTQTEQLYICGLKPRKIPERKSFCSEGLLKAW